MGSELAPNRSWVQSTTSWNAASIASGSVSQVWRSGRSIQEAGGGDVETQAAIDRSSQPSTSLDRLHRRPMEEDSPVDLLAIGRASGTGRAQPGTARRTRADRQQPRRLGHG